MTIIYSQTLIELSVGNFPNQQIIGNSQVIDSINLILEVDTTDEVIPRVKMYFAIRYG